MDQKIMITSNDVNSVLDNCETRNALGEIGIDIVKRNGANLFISGSNPIHQLQSIFLPTFSSVPLVKNPAEILCNVY